MCLARHHKLVELRRPDGGAGKHGVRLATVVDLVIEQVGDDVAASIALHLAGATVEFDHRVEVGRRQAGNLLPKHLLSEQLKNHFLLANL